MSSLWKPIYGNPQCSECYWGSPLAGVSDTLGTVKKFLAGWGMGCQKVQCNAMYLFQDFPFRWNGMTLAWTDVDKISKPGLTKSSGYASSILGSLHSTYYLCFTATARPHNGTAHLNRKKKTSTFCFGHGTADRWRSINSDQILFNASHVTFKIVPWLSRNR